MTGFAGCAGQMNRIAGKDQEHRTYLLERVEDVAVVQLYVDGFESLPLNERILLYHLYEAAIAGRDIFVDQKYAPSLEIRDLLESVITHDAGIDPDTLKAIRTYTKLFWINNGPHSAVTSQKNVMSCSSEAFSDAVKKAHANGAVLPSRQDESINALLTRLRPILFDPKVNTLTTSKSPGNGLDILTASANNYYEDVTPSDLKGFDEQYPLNSKLVKQADGTLKEIVWRAGFDKDVPEGLYAAQIKKIIHHLEAAIPYATPRMAHALGALIHAYRTGNPTDLRAYYVAWVADNDSPVDTINGFTEVYMDARGQKGAWEALVYFNDPVKMHMIQAFADHAQWFEDRMPFDPQYRKPEVKGISAKAIQVVIETGDSGPVGPIGINLPNPQDVREQYGSKSVSLSNVLNCVHKASSSDTRMEFCYDTAEFERTEKWYETSLDLEVNMHEVIGHASGRAEESLTDTPDEYLKEFYSALEEARADLIALWFMGDPHLAKLDLVSEKDLPEIQQACYEMYTREGLSQLRRVRTGTTLEEDHMRNRQLIVHWLMKNTTAIEVKRKDNKTYYVATDARAWQQGVGRLLTIIQHIKSTGDYAAAKTLMEEHAIHLDPALRDEVLARWDALDRPAYTGLVMPKLTAVRNKAGDIKDVTISYPQDLETQMLEWSRKDRG